MVSIVIIIERAVDLLFYPFETIHPMWAMTVVSVVVGGVALVVYKYTSNQDGIKEAKERIKGHFYELWIYIDDLRCIVRAQGGIIKNASRYLGYALVPLAVMLIPIFILFANMEERYDFRPLKPGEDVLIKMKLSGEVSDFLHSVSLDLPGGVKLAAPPVRYMKEIRDGQKLKGKEYVVMWKVHAEAEGDQALTFHVGQATEVISLKVGGRPTRLNPFTTTSLGTALLYPPTQGIPGQTKIETIEIKYPAAEFPFFGWHTWWVWPFLIISIVAAFFLKGPLKVEI